MIKPLKVENRIKLDTPKEKVDIFNSTSEHIDNYSNLTVRPGLQFYEMLSTAPDHLLARLYLNIPDTLCIFQQYAWIQVLPAELNSFSATPGIKIHQEFVLKQFYNSI